MSHGQYSSFRFFIMHNLTRFVTRTCDLPGRTEVALMITDAKGNVNWSAGTWIKNTTDASCLSTQVNATGGSNGSGMVTVGNGTTVGVPGVGAANATMPAHSSGIGYVTPSV